MFLISGLVRQPFWTNSAASQSSNSGCVGGSPDIPRFSEVGTMPTPVRCCQSRLTITRATSPAAGVPGWVSQWARAVRRPLLPATGRPKDANASGPADNTSIKPGRTSSPGVLNSPRSSRCVAGGGPTS